MIGTIVKKDPPVPQSAGLLPIPTIATADMRYIRHFQPEQMRLPLCKNNDLTQFLMSYLPVIRDDTL